MLVRDRYLSRWERLLTRWDPALAPSARAGAAYSRAHMSLPLLVIIVVATALAIGAMLGAALCARGQPFHRQRPRGGRVRRGGHRLRHLLGFVVLLAFDSYSHAKSTAATEATAVADSFQTASLFPAAERDDLEGALVCYARAVIHQGWPAMTRAEPSSGVEVWTYRLERVADTLHLQGTKQDDAFAALLTNRDTREEARRERIGAAGHTVPTIMWVLLILACAAPLLFLLFFADPAEPAPVQALLMGVVAALMAAAILAVIVLDSPFSGKDGSIEPKAMQYTLRVMEHDRAITHGSPSAPCDANGRPLRA